MCGEADDLPSGIAAVRKLRPDMAIVDISLKGAYGTDLIRQIREDFPRLRILVLSMHEESLYAECALRAGAKGYITKQEATRNILLAIRQVLQGNIYLNERMSAALLGKVVGAKPAFMSSPVDLLSDRELEIFRRIGQGFGGQQLADEMHLSVKTIETHCARIKEKLDLKDSSGLLRYAIHWMRTEPNQ